MASPCSGSTHIPSSGSEQDPTRIMDQRKRKRMISNRESARRSRVRKQQHLDELVARTGQLTEENRCIAARVSVTTQMYAGVEAENSVLRAQLDELTHRLDSVNEIINCWNSNNGGVPLFEGADDHLGVDQMIDGGDFLNPWNLMYLNQPIMASPDMFMY